MTVTNTIISNSKHRFTLNAYTTTIFSILNFFWDYLVIFQDACWSCLFSWENCRYILWTLKNNIRRSTHEDDTLAIPSFVPSKPKNWNQRLEREEIAFPFLLQFIRLYYYDYIHFKCKPRMRNQQCIIRVHKLKETCIGITVSYFRTLKIW